jgi:broad specificity phosphatase PhoE
MPRWVFLRHGESEANRVRCVTGQSDSPLTDLGREQAAAAGQALADQLFQRALCSDLSRARDTARIVLTGRDVELEETPLLAERDVGTFSGRNLDELRDSGENHLLLGWHTRPPEGESMACVALRVLPFLASLEPAEGPVLLVAHGGVLRAHDPGPRAGYISQAGGRAGPPPLSPRRSPCLKRLAPRQPGSR